MNRGMILWTGLCLTAVGAAEMSGCAAALTGEGMFSKSAPTRSKGEGTRRTVIGARDEVYETLSEEWAKMGSDFMLDKGENSLTARMSNPQVNMSYTAYLYPSGAANKTDVEIVVTMPYLEPAKLAEMEARFLSDLSDKVELRRYRKGAVKTPADPPPDPAAQPLGPAADAVSETPKLEAPKPKPTPNAQLDSQL